MDKQSSVIDRIHILYDSFFEQERKIADYILQHHQDVVNMTISELAKACGTSVATISRFCKKCQVDGFHHLKIELAKEIVEGGTGYTVSNTISREDIGQSLQNILANKIEEMKQTVSYIEGNTFSAVLEAISQAGIVQLVAVGNTIPVAIDGAFRFNEIGIKAVAGTIWETQTAFSLSLRKGDVMIAISNSGESRKVMTMVQEAKKNGVITIGITNNPMSTIGNLVDYHIQTATREKLFLNEFYFSRVSAMTVIEIIYLFLTVGKESSYQELSKRETLFSDEKM
ncbi:MurR/RpiR family transcriptional regulator [Streptococcus parauberis]|uniref:MurR/RpiR family transcriptional regulator n=2 Tax=Streptococcus parauberis TaxID=1348 RepID=UPI00020CBCBA|nr:MurR/RpiR family transcriptional regulator [Streptococcus parauberis]AEF25971.1 transcriptional regulator, RpiR family [Streptococcus parauberis KCTC 11537]UWM90810.1 MurR/RpiR family transcriptional regulator [Streptococcus parauberis]WEM62964.1 MurR/RpiR family transcriptional regulator [Streptococcus parauberis]GAJ61329.1 RpiR family transcriptional regulator [Streptococcus parauberis]